MSIKDRIEEWKNTANTIGSEARAAVLVGEIAAALDEETPPEVIKALKVFGLRSVMREIVPFYQGILADEHDGLHVGDDCRLPSVRTMIEASAAISKFSWTESISTITCYFDKSMKRLGYPD